MWNLGAVFQGGQHFQKEKGMRFYISIETALNQLQYISFICLPPGRLAN
jgi:hypothetical protein